MESGIFLIMPHVSGASLRSTLMQAICDAELSENLGYDRVWLTEHHGTDYGACWSPSVMAAAIAARTKRIGIGYAVNVAPLHQPRRLAEDIALVDHLSGGRVTAGFGSGYSKIEYGILGANFEERVPLTKSTVDEVIDLWSRNDPECTDGVACFQSPYPSVVIACRSDESIRAVAHAGHGVLLLGDLDRLARGTKTYREIMGANGYVGVLRHVLVHDEKADVTDEVRSATSWTLDRMKKLVGSDSKIRASDIDKYLLERSMIGTVDTVRSRLHEISDFGVSELLCWMRWGNLSDATVHKSMTLYSTIT